MSQDTLFSPFEIKNHVLRNRIGVAPMTRMSSVKDGVPRQDVLDFLVRRAENGAAIVYTEECRWKGDLFRRHIVCYKTPDFGKKFTPAKAHEFVRVAMDVGHELGHLVVEGPPGKLRARPGIPPDALMEIEEAECDFFAICVLQMYGMVFPDQTV